MITLSTASHGLTAGQVVRSEADTWPVQSTVREGRQVETGEREQLTHNGAYFEKYIFIHCQSQSLVVEVVKFLSNIYVIYATCYATIPPRHRG